MPIQAFLLGTLGLGPGALLAVAFAVAQGPGKTDAVLQLVRHYLAVRREAELTAGRTERS